MGNKTATREISKPKFYIPERVFFHNLFRCCQCDYPILFDKINDIMREEIREYQFDIECQIDDIDKEDLPTSSDKYFQILPTSFIKHVEGNYQQRSPKNADYVLTKCHLLIRDAEYSLKQIVIKRNFKPSDMGKDKEILKKLEILLRNSEALSERQLHRILEPFDVVQGVSYPRGKTYDTYPDYIVRFTISKVFPRMQTPHEKSFLSSLISNDWKDIVYKVQAKNKTHVSVISVANDNQNEFEICMQQHFSKLKSLASNSYLDNPSIIVDIGETLLAMYDEICNYSKSEKIFGLRYNSISSANYSRPSLYEQNPVIIKEDVKYKYNVEISSHILNFMRWIHMPPIDNRGFLESMDRIIDKIHHQTVKKIGSTFTLEEFCTFRKNDSSSDSLFLWGDNTDLLYQLIDAMHDEFYLFDH